MSTMMTLGIDVAVRAKHRATLADDRGEYVWSGHGFRTTPKRRSPPKPHRLPPRPTHRPTNPIGRNPKRPDSPTHHAQPGDNR